MGVFLQVFNKYILYLIFDAWRYLQATLPITYIDRFVPGVLRTTSLEMAGGWKKKKRTAGVSYRRVCSYWMYVLIS